MSALNYRHLYYFWVVAKEGGMARAAQRLDIAIQTISSQVRELEKSLGHQLLKPQGRGLALTEAGEAAYARAEEIFEIGQRIPREVADAAAGPAIRLSIGLSDGLSKLAAHSLLDPVLQTPGLRLVCHEGEFEHLMADLALHPLNGSGWPPPYSRVFLESRLAYRIQEQAFGALPSNVRKMLVEAGAKHSKIKSSYGRSAQTLLMPGTTLIREWDERKFRVTVTPDGLFDLNGQVFRSLSAVARHITGTHWNGPKFFGLRDYKTGAQ